MGKKLESVLNVTVIPDDSPAVQPESYRDGPSKRNSARCLMLFGILKNRTLSPSEPSAKLIDGCITGIKRLKPPAGKLGKRATPPKIEWHSLEAGTVSEVGNNARVSNFHSLAKYPAGIGPETGRTKEDCQARSRRRGSLCHGNRRRRFASANCKPILSQEQWRRSSLRSTEGAKYDSQGQASSANVMLQHRRCEI